MNRGYYVQSTPPGSDYDLRYTDERARASYLEQGVNRVPGRGDARADRRGFQRVCEARGMQRGSSGLNYFLRWGT